MSLPRRALAGVSVVVAVPLGVVLEWGKGQVAGRKGIWDGSAGVACTALHCTPRGVARQTLICHQKMHGRRGACGSVGGGRGSGKRNEQREPGVRASHAYLGHTHDKNTPKKRNTKEYKVDDKNALSCWVGYFVPLIALRFSLASDGPLPVALGKRRAHACVCVCICTFVG